MAALPRVKSSSATVGPALIPLGHHQGKPPIPLLRPVIVIGSRSNARIHLVSSTVSKAHALVVRSHGRSYIRDLSSRTKVIINDKAVCETELVQDDVLRIGSFTFKYVAGPSEGRLPRTPAPGAMPIPAKLEVSGSDLPYPIDQRVILVGRRSVCDLHLLEDSVSTAHAVIFEIDGKRFVRDLGSRTGTFVNGVSTHQHQLSPGDRIRIGETEMRYVPSDIAPADVTEEEPSDASHVGLVDRAAASTAVEPLEEALEAEPEVTEPVLRATPPPPMPPPDEALELSPLDVPEIDEPAIAAGEPEIPVASADIEDEPVALSAEPEIPVESSSTPEIDADQKHEEIDHGEIDLAAGELPRRGWRGATGQAEGDEPIALEPAADGADAEEVAQQPPEDSTESVLKFPDSISTIAPPDEPVSIELDSAALQEHAADESVAEIEQNDLGLQAQKLQELLRPTAPAEPIERPASATTLDLSKLQEREPEPIAAEAPAAPPPLVDEPVAEAILDLAPPTAAATPAEESARPLIASIEMPTAPPPAAEQPVEVEPAQVKPVKLPAPRKPRKSRKKDALDPSLVPEAPLAADVPAAIEAPVLPPEPVVEVAAVAPPVEVIESTEPTNESALQETADQLALDVLAGPDSPATPVLDEAAPTVDELSDTTFDKAVREFAGSEIGEIVEPAATEAPKTLPDIELESPPPAETAAIVPEPQTFEPVAETPAPAASPAVPWGANQDNFLGGSPLDLKVPPKPPSLSETPIGGEDAVKDLIEEIDTAAAKAQAATAPEETPSVFQAIPPPRPMRKPGSSVFRATARRKRDDIVPDTPFDPDARAPGKLTTGFDALAMPPVREMDVFSQMSPPSAATAESESAIDTEEHDPVGDAEALETPQEVIDPLEEVAEPTRARRPRGSITGAFEPESTDAAEQLGRRQKVIPALAGSVDGTLVSSGDRRPSVTYAAEVTEAEAAAVRRKYFRRMIALIVAMFALVGGSAWGVWNYLGVRRTVEGSLQFINLEKLTQLERTRIQNEQYRLLKDKSTRELARRALINRYPEIPPGFLDDEVEFFKTVERAAFSEQRPDLLLVHVQGSDRAADEARVGAILSAMYTQNARMVNEAAGQRKNLETLKSSIADSQRQIDAITAEIDRLRLLGQNAPTREQIKDLEDDVTRLEKAWNDSVAAVKVSEAELAQMKSVPAVAGATTTPSASPEDDEKMKLMQQELDSLLAKVNEEKQTTSAQAAGAKQALDAALDAFQKQVADAQGMMNGGNPEIAAYIDAATKLQESTRQLTDALIRRQEQQFGRLMELKERLNEKMEQRRVELWQGDKQMQELTEHLALATRQYNAAVGGGLQKEADDKKAEMELVKSMIKARQDLLPPDTFYAEAVQQLQVIIDSTKKNIDEDRAKTEQLLTSLQQSFTHGQSVEKLPAEQKQLAADLQKKLDEINSARKSYNQAVDTTAADVDEKLKTQVSTLQAAIESRRKQLADDNMKNLRSREEQGRVATIETKQAELAKLNQAEATARQAYFDKHKQLREAQAVVDDSKANEGKLDAALRQKDVPQRQLEANLAQVEFKTKQVSQAVEPIKPDEKNISAQNPEDRRLMYIGISSGAIIMLFSALILWTFHSASVHAPAVSIQAADLRPISAEQLTPENSNGSTPAKNGGNGTDEDHAPAVI